MTQIKIAYSTVPLNYLASCYSIPPVWFPQWPIPSHLFNHRELEIWMEWQLGQSSINQFLFVYSSITSIGEKFSWRNWTLWPRGGARKKQATRRRGRWDAIPPSSDEESADDETACDVGEIPSLERAEEVFTSTAEFCLVNFFLFSLLWNYGIAITFCFLMLLLTLLFVLLILIMTCLY